MSPPRSNSGRACAIGLAYNIRFCAMAPGDSCGFLSDETGEKAVVLIPRRGEPALSDGITYPGGLKKGSEK